VRGCDCDMSLRRFYEWRGRREGCGPELRGYDMNE